jgi:hypothetical protein
MGNSNNFLHNNNSNNNNNNYDENYEPKLLLFNRSNYNNEKIKKHKPNHKHNHGHSSHQQYKHFYKSQNFHSIQKRTKPFFDANFPPSMSSISIDTNSELTQSLFKQFGRTNLNDLDKAIKWKRCSVS